jgi:FkbM family methyltransferase
MNKLVKFTRILRCPFFLYALLKGVAAGIEHLPILNSLNCRTVIDIGANRGQFALIVRRQFPKTKIIAFEPLKEPAKIFRRVFANDPYTTLYEFAIGPEEVESIIHVSNIDDSSSLLPISELQNKLYPGTAEKETRSIKVKPLAAILSPSEIQTQALLKIDVQGYEKHVLEGCRSLFPLFHYVYVECSFIELYTGQALAYEIIAYLSDFGYSLTGIYNLDMDSKGISIQGDFLFTRL